MSTVIEDLEKRALKQRPRFAAGDRVRVHFQVVEGNRRRTQVFEGIVIKRQGSGARETFTVRKQSFGVGVERTFPLHSPKIEKLEVAARGDVRRAKLYYLREKVGKSARVAERRWGIEEEMVVAAEDAEAVDAEGVAVSEAEAEVVEPAEEEGEEQSEGEEQPAEPEQPAEEEQPPAEEEEEQPAEEEQPQAEGEQGANGGETAEAESEPEPKAKADASPGGAED
jgi:large subunit ribosomal protein L19